MYAYETPAVLGSFDAQELMGEAIGSIGGGSCEYYPL